MERKFGMQSGCEAQQGSGHGRNPKASRPQQQQQAYRTRQMQQQQRRIQILKMAEEKTRANQARGVDRVMPMDTFTETSAPMQLRRQPINFVDPGQRPLASSSVGEEGHCTSRSFEQQLMYPLPPGHERVYASKVAKLRPAPRGNGIQCQQQVVYQPIASSSSSEKLTDHLPRSEPLVDLATEHLHLLKCFGTLMASRPEQSELNFQNRHHDQLSGQYARYTTPSSTPQWQSMMTAERKGNTSNGAAQISAVHTEKQPFTSAMVANKSSPVGGISTHASMQSSSAMFGYPFSTAPDSAYPNAAVFSSCSSNSLLAPQLPHQIMQNRLHQIQSMVGNGMSPTTSWPLPLVAKQGLENVSVTKGARVGSETQQMQHGGRKPSWSYPQSSVTTVDRVSKNPSTSYDGKVMETQEHGDTKLPMDVIRAFQNLKSCNIETLVEQAAASQVELRKQLMELLVRSLKQENKIIGKNAKEHDPNFDLSEKAPPHSIFTDDEQQTLKQEVGGDEGAVTPVVNVQSEAAAKEEEEPTPVASIPKEEQQQQQVFDESPGDSDSEAETESSIEEVSIDGDDEQQLRLEWVFV